MHVLGIICIDFLYKWIFTLVWYFKHDLKIRKIDIIPPLDTPLDTARLYQFFFNSQFQESGIENWIENWNWNRELKLRIEIAIEIENWNWEVKLDGIW